MVGTWLLELYLDQLNRSMLELRGRPQTTQPQDRQSRGPQLKEQQQAQPAEAAGGLPVPEQLTQDLRAFLKRNVTVLDVNVTVSLLAGYGRLDDLMEYATYRKVWFALCACYSCVCECYDVVPPACHQLMMQ